jgi:hypothetical protein
MAFLEWWYRLSAPPLVPASESSITREQSRRARLASTILLVVILLQLANLLVAHFSGTYRSLPILALSLAVCALAVRLNRWGMAGVAGILVIAVIDLGCGLLLLATPNGLDVGDLPAYDILAESELIAVSLLPAASVFPVAAGNCVFILLDLALQAHTPALGRLLASPGVYDALARPLGLQIVVAIVAYLWVRSALSAAARADRAEEIADLRQREAERSRQLEAGIQQLLETQVRAANGDLTARAALNQDNVLWKVGVSLNLLLARLQQTGQADRELQRVRGEVLQLTEAVREAKAGRSPQWPWPSGTLLDPLIQEVVPAPHPSPATPPPLTTW